MAEKRFRLEEINDSFRIFDSKGKLCIDRDFSFEDKNWLDELISFLNDGDEIIHKSVVKYGESVFELNKLKENITTILNEEIKDCELLFNVDEEDLYTQGRLVEIHNLMKILLK